MSQPTRVYLISDNRQTGESNTNFTNNLQGQLNDAKSVDVVQVSFYNLSYPFTNTNNKLTITQGATTFTFEIAKNQVWDDGVAFSTYLELLLQTQFPNLEVTYDLNTKAIKIEDTTATNFTIQTNNNNIECLRKLGFSHTQILTGNDEYTANSPLNIGLSPVYYLQLSLADGSALTPDGGGYPTFYPLANPGYPDKYSLALQMPVTQAFGDLFTYSEMESQFSHPVGQTVSNIRVTIYDQYFEFLELPETIKVYVELRFKY